MLSKAGAGQTPFDMLDAVLEQHPFGNSKYITDQMHVCYGRRLLKLSPRLPIAGRLHDALRRAKPNSRYRVIGDSIVRCAIQHAHVQIETEAPYGLPLDQCEEVLCATVRLLEEGKVAPLGSGLTERIGPRRYHGWVWSEEDYPDDVLGRAFRDVVRDNYSDATPRKPRPEELEMLREGARLLSQLVPRLARSALSHTHLVVVYPQMGAWISRPSSSEFRISGTVFLGCTVLSNPWTVVEHLFHESLHQQIYDIRASHSLLHPDFVRPGAPLIHSPWNKPDSSRGNYWDIHRALAAFHVYVHLALLSSIAEERGSDFEEYGPVRMVGKRTALARAHYLAEQIRERCWEELGAAGKRLVDWFDSILEALDPSPPAPGAYVHLLLDRYWKEAIEIEHLLTGSRGRQGLSAGVAILLDEEVGATRSVLGMLDRDLGAFNRALDSFSGQDPATRFLSVRTLVAETILRACPGSFRLSKSMKPDELVREMIEGSSETLNGLVAA